MKTFSERVLEAALAIPEGRVTTYGRLARACGSGGMAAQSITAILGKASQEKGIAIPFHRIVYADGRIWSSKDKESKRLKLYKEEGIEVTEKGKIRDFTTIVFDFI